MRSIAFVFVLGLCSCAKDYSFVNEDKPNKEDLAPDASAGAGELLCLDEETCYRKDELEALTPVELGDNAFSCNGQGICYRASALDILIPVEPDRIADDFTCLPTGVCLRNASLRDLTPLTPQELTDLLENKVSCREDGVCYRATALRDLKEEEENAKGVTCLTNGACYRARNIEELTPLSQADLTSLAEGARRARGLECGPGGCAINRYYWNWWTGRRNTLLLHRATIRFHRLPPLSRPGRICRRRQPRRGRPVSR